MDLGCIMSRPSEEELKMVSGFQQSFNVTPNCVTDVYKNRRGRWTQIRIWQYKDLGTCRTYDLFVTTPTLEPIQDFQVIEFIEEESEELQKLEEEFNFGTEPVIEETIENKSATSGLIVRLNRGEDIENDIKPKEIKITKPKKMTEEISEAFGNLEQRKARVRNMSFDDF